MLEISLGTFRLRMPSQRPLMCTHIPTKRKIGGPICKIWMWRRVQVYREDGTCIVEIILSRIRQEKHQNTLQLRQKKTWTPWEKDSIMNFYRFWRKNSAKKIKEKPRYRLFQILKRLKWLKDNLELKELKPVKKSFR